jgi:dUTPase
MNVQYINTATQKVTPTSFDSLDNIVGIYPLADDVKIPQIMTRGSACADLCCNFTGIKELEFINTLNGKAYKRDIIENTHIFFPPFTKVKLPTNLIFDIPENFKIVIYPRSSIKFNMNLSLINSPAIIDSDYVDQVYLLLENLNDFNVKLESNMRLAQIELQPVLKVVYTKLDSPPKQKTERTGGIGSTKI